jgi:RNA polymerase sigma-70 factor (ECF subfamily)
MLASARTLAMPTEPGELSRAFLRAAGIDGPPEPALEQALASVIAMTSQTWPDIHADALAFAAYLGQRIPSDVAVQAALRDRAVGDMYLAFAVLAGDAAATREIEERFSALVRLLVQQGFAEDLARDTIQQLRVQMLAGERPGLRTYCGIGALKAWLRISAMREAIRGQRKVRGHEGDELTDVFADPAGDPALQYQRQLYHTEFRNAFEEAVARLSVRDRNLLRQNVLYGATVDDLGAIYQVHRATAARWIAAARERLVEATRQRMIAILRIQPEDYDSILTLIDSQLDVSIERVLGEPATA